MLTTPDGYLVVNLYCIESHAFSALSWLGGCWVGHAACKNCHSPKGFYQENFVDIRQDAVQLKRPNQGTLLNIS